jgi:hypothetical protein
MPLSISVVIPYYNGARLTRIAWRAIGNRWRRTYRVAFRTPAVTTDGSA